MNWTIYWRPSAYFDSGQGSVFGLFWEMSLLEFMLVKGANSRVETIFGREIRSFWFVQLHGKNEC